MCEEYEPNTPVRDAVRAVKAPSHGAWRYMATIACVRNAPQSFTSDLVVHDVKILTDKATANQPFAWMVYGSGTCMYGIDSTTTTRDVLRAFWQLGDMRVGPDGDAAAPVGGVWDGKCWRGAYTIPDLCMLAESVARGEFDARE